MATGDLSRIRTNIGALNALNALENINSQLTQTNLRLATGKRINSSGDDPAGLSLANTLDLRARKVAMAQRNVGDAQNVLDTVEGGLSNLNDLLTSISEKIVLASNGDTRRAFSAAFHGNTAARRSMPVWQSHDLADDTSRVSAIRTMSPWGVGQRRTRTGS